MNNPSFTVTNMSELECLMAIESIMQLKARYFRYLDEKDWQGLRSVFTDDFTGLYEGPHPDVHYTSADEIVQQMQVMLADAITVHHGHMPEIQLLSDTEATGIWAMMDFVKFKEQCFRGYGSYRDKYRKTENGWKIHHTHLTRLHVQNL